MRPPGLGQFGKQGIELGDHVLRMQPLHRGGGIAAEPMAHCIVAGQLHGGGHKFAVVIHGDAVLIGTQVFAGGAVVEGDRGQATGHGFKGHVAEGFAAAGEQEQIAAGEMPRQRVPALYAAEDEIRVVVGQLGARWTIADEDEARLRPYLLQTPEGLDRQAEVLLRRDAAEVDRRKAVAVDAPFLAQGRVATLGFELAAVHRARQQADPVEALFAEELLQLLGRHQGGIGLVVEAPHPAQCGCLQPGHAVIGQVLVEAGMEAGRDRNAEAPRGPQGRPAQRSLGGDVDRVRTLLLPLAAQAGRRGQTEAQAGVARQAGTADQHGAFGGIDIARLPGPDQIDLVAGGTQAQFQALHGQGDAVDFRGIGFGDDGIAHGGPPVCHACWGRAM